MILYNIALILQKLASQLLRDEKSTLEEVLQVGLVLLKEKESIRDPHLVVY